MMLQLQPFQLDVRHHKESEMYLADTSSRAVVDPCKEQIDGYVLVYNLTVLSTSIYRTCTVALYSTVSIL